MNATVLSLALFCLVAPPVKTEKTPQTLLYVRTTPTGAEIRLGDKPLGKSDDLFPVKPGDYKIVIDLEGHQPSEQKITVREGRITRIELELKKGPKPPLSTLGDDPATGELGSAEEVFRRYQTAFTEFDFSKLEPLFLPFEDTPAGYHRRKLLDDSRRIWPGYREELREWKGKGPYSLTDIKQKVEGKDRLVSATIMFTHEDTERAEGVFEVRITPTDRGWKIAEVKMLPEQVWTCSMHRQVKLPWESKCPVCAMDLVRLPPEARKVHLSDADTKGAEVVLDLASGQTLVIDTDGEDQIGQFDRLGKGDLMYDRLLGCLRGAKARLWKGNDIVTLPEEDRQGTATAYKLPEVPCRLLITTAEKKQFDVTILSVTDSGGINLEYRPVEVEKAVEPRMR